VALAHERRLMSCDIIYMLPPEGFILSGGSTVMRVMR